MCTNTLRHKQTPTRHMRQTLSLSCIWRSHLACVLVRQNRCQSSSVSTCVSFPSPLSPLLPPMSVPLFIVISSSPLSTSYCCAFYLCINPSLLQSSKVHVTRPVLDIVLAFSRYLSNLQNGVLLLKQLCDHILFNPAIWIHAPSKVM